MDESSSSIRHSYNFCNNIGHYRSYVLFFIGSFLLYDTLCSKVFLQYLFILEELNIFSTFSLSGAILVNLYRELLESTQLKWANMVGCLYLLHIWSQEHLYIGRPTLHMPCLAEFDGLSIGSCTYLLFTFLNKKHIFSS